MSILKPFSSEKAKFLLEGEVHLTDSLLKLEFFIVDKLNLFGLPSTSSVWSGASIPKEDELWKHTCFECFLNPKGMSLYYELNFSLMPAWNLYLFDRYRYPQPPKRAAEFELKSMNWDQFESKLKVELVNHTKFKKFNVGLAAVMEEKAGQKHYCALGHKGTQPDFHLLESFTLVRG